MKMKKTFLLILSALLAAGCANQLRSLNGTFSKTAGAVEVSDPQNDYVIDASIPIPTMVSATQGDFSDRIRISWQQVFYGDSQIQYHVYRETQAKDGETALLRLTGYRPIADLYFDDLASGTVEPGVVYRYYVRAVNMSSPNTEGSVLSAPTEGYALAGVSTISADFRVSTEKVTVTWGAVNGASFYYLYRAVEPYEGVVPNLENFERLDQAFTGLSYDDYSVTNGGALESGKSYYYYVEACFDRETTAERSGYARGALLSAGAPAEGSIESVSQNAVLGAIRVAWKTDANAESYFVYRITQENLDGGDYVGTEIAVDQESLKTANGSTVWYDTDPVVATGEPFYYRVAAVNDYGAGSLSSSNISEVGEQLRVTGRAIPSAAGTQPYIMLQRNGFYVSWPQTFSGAGYYLLAADGSSGSAPSTDAEWKLIGSGAVTATETTVSESDLSSVLNGTQIADAKLYFRVLPVNTTLVTAYDPATGVYFLNYRQMLDSQYGRPDAWTCPVAIHDHDSDWLKHPEWYYSDYSMNEFIASDIRAFSASASEQVALLDGSRIIRDWVGASPDKYWVASSQINIDQTGMDVAGSLAFPHLSYANVAFYDGHAEKVRRNELKPSRFYDKQGDN